MRQAVLPCVGRCIADLWRPRGRLRPITIEPAFCRLRRRVRGRRICGVQRVGKRLAFELDDGARLVIEPRMTGLLLAQDPPDDKHLRLVIALAGAGIIQRIYFWDQRGLGTVRLVDSRQFAELWGVRRIGPDALQVSADELRSRLENTQRPIKVALMDQRCVAGIGNIYASEILHRTKIHPAVPCCELSAGDWAALGAAMHKVLRQAIRCGGSTLGDGTYRLSRTRKGAFQRLHRVYGRQGQRCRQCGRAQILRIVQAQRSTFYCPACQPPR